jgi:hypothetical protein
VSTLRSWMSALDYIMEPEVECTDNNVNIIAFVQATSTIRGHDAVVEFLACGMYPLASSFGFRDVALGTTVVSKVKTPLPLFPVEAVSVEDAGCFLTKVETDTKNILGSYGPREHDAVMTAILLNSGHLNQVFEQMGVPYAPCPLLGTEAFQAATKKRKAEVSKNRLEKGEGCSG